MMNKSLSRTIVIAVIVLVIIGMVVTLIPGSF